LPKTISQTAASSRGAGRRGACGRSHRRARPDGAL